MKKRWMSVLCAFVSLIMATGLCAGCLGEAAEPAGAATRTILLYDCGSDLEGDYALATWNLYQIMEAEIPDDVNVVVLTGGALRWLTEPEYLEGAAAVSENRQNQAWICSGRNGANAADGHGKMTLLTDLPADIETTLMSDPRTLLGFIDYAVEKYPARMYDLILWDHGGGPQGGFGVDDRVLEYNVMSVGQIAKTVKQSKAGHFDIIDFDACLMGSAEVVAALAECADYLILSPEIEPGFGQEYVTVMNALAADSDMNGFELGRVFVDAFIAFYEDESSFGYGMDGTLAVVDTAAFRARLMPAVTELARIMERELTTVGSENLLLNFEDEFRSQAASYAYEDASLLDLGNFAEHLGMDISEVDNTSPRKSFEMLENGYTATAMEIAAILADCDGSGDDVIYARATRSLTKPVRTKAAYARGAEGKPEPVETFAPTGLSLFFAPMNVKTMNYVQALDEMCEAVEDEDILAMLRAVEVASLRYMLAAKAGYTVARLRGDGEKNVYYKTVRDDWRSYRELEYTEISQYMQQIGQSALVTGMYASDWNAYVGTVIDKLNACSPVDTETWLALLTAQQSSQTIDPEDTKAIGVDRDGDGVEDAYRITVGAPLKLVGDVSLSLSLAFPEEETEPGENEEISDFSDIVRFLNLPDGFSLGRIHGNPVQEEIVRILRLGGDLDDGVRSLFSRADCDYELPAAVDAWYELVDSDGVGHVIAVDDVDLAETRDLRIPVNVKFAEPRPDGRDWEENGFFVYGDGHFKGFVSEDGYSPMIPLDSIAFNGAVVRTAVVVPFDFFGMMLGVYAPVSDAFTMPAARDRDRGMKLVLTPLAQIADLEGKTVVTAAAVTDLYGCRHDISAAVRAARERAADGTLATGIGACEITVAETVYNRRRQEPAVTVTLNGRTLREEEDYILAAEPMLKAGTQEITVFGIGEYVGYQSALFVMRPAGSTVKAAEAVAAGDLAEADVTVLTVETPAHPDSVTFDFTGTDEALRGLLRVGDDGKSVLLGRGAPAGAYTVAVTVAGGEADTYANIDAETYVIEVK